MIRDLRAVATGVLLGLVVSACGTDPPTPASTPTATVVASAHSTTRPSPAAPASPTQTPEPTFELVSYPVTPGAAPHDVAPAADGGIWYTAQATGRLGWLDPQSGEVREIALGAGSRPHGVIVGPDGAAWVTDGGLNAVVRVDPETDALTVFAVPPGVPEVNMNTAAFDGDGLLWWTGQQGWYGSVDPASGEVTATLSPGGPGPYGIATMPDGRVVYSSLAGSHLGFIGPGGEVTVVETATPGAGARRVWSDSAGVLWVAEWFAGNLGRYDPAADEWREWRLPGDTPQPYAVFVDDADDVWLTDFGANAIVRFDPETEAFTPFPLESRPANVRQLLGRSGEVWGAESAADRLVVIRRGP